MNILKEDLTFKWFDICVEILMDWSRATGMSYEEINIWLFVIIQPLLIIVFMIAWMREVYKRNKTISLS